MALPGENAGSGVGRAACVMVAEHVVSSGDLDLYVPGPHPDRPVDIPLDDEALSRILQRVARARSRPAQDDRETAANYRRWSGMLLHAESRSRGRLQFLACCYEDLRDEHADAYLQSCAGKIREHAEYHWPRFRFDKLPPREQVAARDVYLGTACRRNDLIATWLLRGLKSPRFIPEQAGADEQQDDGEEGYGSE